MGDGGGRQEDMAIEVGEQELGTALVAIEADDAEVFGADLLHARVQDAPQLAEAGRRLTTGRTFAGVSSRHGTSLQKRDGAHPILAAGARQEFFIH